jgi:hypothetical protein
MPNPTPPLYNVPRLDLTPVFSFGVGYHSASWIEIESATTDDGRTVFTTTAEPPMLHPLDRFIGEVSRIVVRENDDRRIGVAYMRVIDGAKPENYMVWHVDNPDGAVRFHTAIATDDAKVNLAWLQDADLIGAPVERTWQTARFVQPANGVIVKFTTEPHGVLPQDPRPGHLTAIFFATLYRTRAEADLYTTNNTQTGSHAMLPRLEPTRGPQPR